MSEPTTKPLDLGDHLLWPDGVISVKPDALSDWIIKLASKGKLKQLAVTEPHPEVDKYNAVADHRIIVKTGANLDLFPPDWTLPEHYKYLDLDEYLVGLADRIERDGLYEQRVKRLSEEIFLFKKLDLDLVLRALIYILDVMTEKKQVWGVGRGSSCSSYLLYLLGLHDVDPVKYGIEVTDFIRE